ncbi:hypothetical protein [Pontibacter cellulosilyticus]|uniref:Uncharacterized protein n=1 Tax=Pontibacter cellulosilyticus TaxID=1720253 RepID=A0A923N3X1_9BACT|nr:hypothetical protein [Pontibacter cellulosilyticus]MBC5992430.1 hypothetical protein [Pontibacter cellulosilyticus]
MRKQRILRKVLIPMIGLKMLLQSGAVQVEQKPMFDVQVESVTINLPSISILPITVNTVQIKSGDVVINQK